MHVALCSWSLTEDKMWVSYPIHSYGGTIVAVAWLEDAAALAQEGGDKFLNIIGQNLLYVWVEEWGRWKGMFQLKGRGIARFRS